MIWLQQKNNFLLINRKFNKCKTKSNEVTSSLMKKYLVLKTKLIFNFKLINRKNFSEYETIKTLKL